MEEKDLQKLITEGNKKIKCNKNPYKNNARHDYDILMIEKFKIEHPEKVEKIKEELLRKQPKLKYDPKNLNRKINKEILPPILEKLDGYFYSTKNEEGKKIGQTSGGYHLSINENNHESVTEEWAKSMVKASENYEIKKGRRIMIELIEDLLEELTTKEVDIIKTLYDIPPCDEYCEENLKKKYGLSDAQIEEEHKRILRKLRILMSKGGQ